MIENKPKKKKNKMIWIFIIIALAFIVFVSSYVFFSPSKLTLSSEKISSSEIFSKMQQTQYFISNLTIRATLQDVDCEQGGKYCHILINYANLSYYFPFDVVNGSASEDNWGLNPTQGTITGSPVRNSTNGKYGLGLYFNGGGVDEVGLSHLATEYQTNTPFTVSMWVKNLGSTVTKGFFGMTDANGAGGRVLIFYYESTKNNLIADFSGSARMPTSALTTTVWRHIVATSDGGTTYTLYVDGVVNSSSTTFGASAWGGTNKISIGRGYNAAYSAQVNIDEVMIFNRSLSSTEISQIYNEQFSRFKNSGNHTLNATIGQGDIVAITTNLNNQQNATGDFTNMSLRISEDLGVTWSAPQNISSGVPYNFTKTSAVTTINLSYWYWADKYYKFFSPIILNITLENFTAEAPPPSDTEYPLFNNFWNSTYNNTQYYPNIQLIFNSTITRTNGTAGIEFNGANYTATNSTSYFRTLIADSPAGTYKYYYWAYGNGTSKLYNKTQTYSWTIAQNLSYQYSLLVNHTSNNFTAIAGILNVPVNATSHSTGYISLYNNGVIINNGTSALYNMTNWTTAGYFNITALYEANTNYSSKYFFHFVNITAADAEYPLFFNFNSTFAMPENNSQYAPDKFYWFNATITSTNGTAGIEFNGVNYSAVNLTSYFNVSITNLAVNNYSYYWWAYGNGTNHLYNITIISDYSVALNNTGNNLTVLLNGANANLVITYPQQINASYIGNNKTTLIIKINNSIEITPHINYTWGAGNYVVNYSAPANQNYTVYYSQLNLTINRATPILTFLANGGTNNLSLIYPQQVNISAYNSSGTLNLEKDNIAYTQNGLNISLGGGSYIFRANITGNQNYSNIDYSHYNITINKTILSGILTSSKTFSYIYDNSATKINKTETNIGDADVTYKIFQNLTDITGGADLNLAGGMYLIKLNSTGGQNYSSNSSIKEENLIIGKNTSLIYAYINNSRSNFITNNLTKNTLLNGTLNTGIGAINSILNDSIINSGNSPLSNVTNLSIGVYYFNATYSGNENYTPAMESWLINIIEYVYVAPPAFEGRVYIKPETKKYPYVQLSKPSELQKCPYVQLNKSVDFRI